MRSASIAAPSQWAGATYRICDAASASGADRLPRGTNVRVNLPGLDPGVAADFETRINASLAECGCRLSALALVAAMFGAVVFDVLEWSVVRQAPVSTIATELIIAFVVSGAGRMAGLAQARRTLRTTLSAVRDQISDLST